MVTAVRVVISGDTKKCDNLTRAAAGADLLISEAMNEGIFAIMRQRMLAAGNERQASVMDDVPSITPRPSKSPRWRATPASRNSCSRTSSRPIPNEGPLADAFANGMSEVFRGEIVVGKDLMRFTSALRDAELDKPVSDGTETPCRK